MLFGRGTVSEPSDRDIGELRQSWFAAYEAAKGVITILGATEPSQLCCRRR
jgi:hypothetical protein